MASLNPIPGATLYSNYYRLMTSGDFQRKRAPVGAPACSHSKHDYFDENLWLRPTEQADMSSPATTPGVLSRLQAPAEALPTMVYRAYTSVFFDRACDTPSENWLAPVLLVLVSSAAPKAAIRVVSPIYCAALRYQGLRSPTAPPTSAFSFTAPMVVAFMMV